MSYLVLARKYRPATFSEVVGQEHVTRTLGNAFAAGRVHHAFLFCGPRGCGKTTLARIVGKALNCERLTPGSAEPCGTCSACTSIGDGSAVDYQEMDGASNRGIDAIRELTEAVRYQPAVLRKKVYVIDEVHMLTTEAFNALLKTLEEPPPHVTFVLATTEPHKLPNTILSRCQRYDFKLVPASRLAQHLAAIFAREQIAIEPGALSLVVRESGGSVRDALSLCDQIISYVGAGAIAEAQVAEVLGVADRSLTRALVGALAAGRAGDALAAVEQAIERGVDEVQLARAIVRYLRDLAVLQVAPDRAGLVDASDEERAELVAEAGAIERGRVTQMFDRMLRCCDELGKTLQPRLVLDCALIDVATLEPLVPLGDLIERLGELEQRIVRGGGGGGGKPAPPPAKPVPAARAVPAPVAQPVSAPPVAQPVSAPVPVAQPVSAPIPAPVIAPSGPVPAIENAASGSGPHPIPTSEADVLREWEFVLGKLAAQNVTLAGAFEPARVMAWTPNRLELGFPAQFEANKELAETKDKLEALRGVLRAEFAQAPSILVKLIDEAAAPAARSVLEATRERSSAERSKREAEAREHPITKHVLHAFGAQIKEIKTDV
ncbi:MAG TPA: DNA polymerase III subunit gamma/tau [Kofleriaceae bacterium]|nr:DNA polymerase III subunit gamma/tau [Kofleriaceae bacterium]